MNIILVIKKILLLIVFVTIALTITSCGSPGPSNPTTSGGPGGGTPTSPYSVIATEPDGGLQNIAWSGNIYVATNIWGDIFTSTDSKFWIHRPYIGTISHIIWGNNLFVATGYNGTIPVLYTSTDGITWILRNSGGAPALGSIAYSSVTRQFIVMGVGEVITSADGITWTRKTAPTIQAYYNIKWVNSQFVAMNISPAGAGELLTSSDGINWTMRIASGATLTGVAGNGSTTVVVGGGGTILTSSDSITWTNQVSPTLYGFNNIVWAGTQFIATGATVATSPDGITWTPRTAPMTPAGTVIWPTLNDIIWTGNKVIAVGSNGASNVLSSIDGINWKYETSSIRSIATSGIQLVSVGTNGTVITSTNGTNWTTNIIPPGSGLILNKITWGKSIFVAVGYDNNTSSGNIFTSPDGVTWTPRLVSVGNRLTSVTFAQNQFVAVGITPSTNIIYTSPDGITWTQRATPVGYGYGLDCVVGNNTQYLAVGPLGTFLASPDGITWASRSVIWTNPITNVTWTNNQFIAVGMSDIYTSSDGINWVLHQGAVGDPLHGAAWTGTQFVAIGDRTALWTSPDGISWQKQTNIPLLGSVSPNLTPFNDVILFGTKLIIVGGTTLGGSTIITSP